ncbi:Phosphatidylinositol kinase (PIK-L4) [Phytophthora cinnamomi]|uniref:Phosphatidylinositol kinase (PIK-L4) n=1 Tax=Phytophthora cinnamomi TaxID=4785 RepID=UPI00355A6CDD|nr:Phosphatidylinositol kinase (PIK-L4) [Phytophthora cinnamomi]
MATRAPAPAPTSAPDEAEKSDVDSLLRLVRAHQRQHDDRTYDSSSPAAIRRCKTMLTKLRKLLPKLMRPVATLPTDRAVPVLQDLCQLLALLLGGGACPHSMTLFMENANAAASGFPSYPTLATMLFYMVSFYTNERLRQAQRDVRNVTLQMVLFLQRNDVYGFIHLFRDTVQLLEDCFLLEESLKNRDDTDVLQGGASIACYLDTAIHVYQDADGPLGAKSNVTLCGCMPITDGNQLYERRKQLKQMLPSIHVSSYGMVVALRESVVALADRIIREHHAMLEGDPSFDRLCQLVEMFIVKNEALVKNADGGFVNGAVSTQGAGEVTRSTLRLLHTMLQRQGRKVIERYQAVIHFDPTWEKGYFFLAKYYEYLLSVSHPVALSGSMRDESVLYASATTGRTSNKANKTLRQIEIGLSQSTTEQKILDDIDKIVNEAADLLPAYEWLVCFPQVTSRICHPNPVVVDGVKKIMIRVLQAYPTQAMWPLLGLSRSLNQQRRNRARDIISTAQKEFLSQGLKEIGDSFSEGMRMVEELISLASHDPGNNQRKIHIRLSRIRTRILVPTQAALTTILPATGLAPRDEEHVAFSATAQIYIKAFSDKADVMMTKEKPKRIEILGTDGQLYSFLCKREKTGDLRKDARMMEFNSMINKLLQKDQEGRKRKLRLRTYAVVVLNEESGLMEWVRNTKAMRQLIGQIHKTERGYIQPVRLTHEIKERYLSMQKKYGNDPSAMARYYRRKVLSMPVFTPRFHQWFYNNFADPTAWFEARLTFSRSAAVWSMVGHIIGLGDRHGENILIDCTNGECVHVDFDCLFDKGLKLAKPEIVPFRLTPNIIDAFGITGYEGVFRRVSEVTMHLLRENKETLRSVLESFIHDPLVEWGRRGKATQSSSGSGKSVPDLSSERTKEETRLVLKTIDDRLRGIYNLGDAIRPLVSANHRSILPETDSLPLSVQGQVDKLIHEATSLENLAQMYIGWMPFL